MSFESRCMHQVCFRKDDISDRGLELILLVCCFQGPVNRRSHAAVLFEDAMYVWGGFIDLRGATNELWKYEFGEFRQCDDAVCVFRK